MVEQGLDGRFELTALRRRHTRRGRLPDGAAVRVLIAEDDPLIALGLAERLRSLGHEPIGPAADGEQAIELARTRRCPTCTCSTSRCRTSTASRRQKQLAGDGLRRPVVVVTGVDDPSLIERSIASGVSAYLTKPIDSRELQAAIELAAARHAEFEVLEAEVDRAQQALEDRKLVERAKGLLMTALDLSEQDAFRRLQLTARERNLRLADVAARIVEQQSLLEPPGRTSL